MNIIMLGAPGAGKGTQAAVLCEKLNIPTISTGNIIREALKNGTEMGLKAKSFMDAGQLVPDEVVIGIIKDRLQESDCQNGFILDGFPRTIPQAEALDAMGGRPYHTESLKPQVDGVCDDCKGALVQRKDDQIDTIKNRLEIYHKETEPLVKYYEAQGKLLVVEGKDTVKATTDAVFEALGV